MSLLTKLDAEIAACQARIAELERARPIIEDLEAACGVDQGLELLKDQIAAGIKERGGHWRHFDDDLCDLIRKAGYGGTDIGLIFTADRFRKTRSGYWRLV